MKRKPCTWNGIEYTSITAAAKANHVTKVTMHYRLGRGYTSDEDMRKVYKGWKKKPCTWNGIRYDSISAAARANYVAVVTMYQRLSKGYSCDADLKW